MAFLDYFLHGYFDNATWVTTVNSCVINMKTECEERSIFPEILDFLIEKRAYGTQTW
jgi:hypothetical protein